MSEVSNHSADGNLSADATAARDARIELDFCAGIKPLRQIGKENSLSHTAVGKMARERGWTRNLKAKIQARADSKVAKAAVSNEVSKQKVASETRVVEVNAELQKQIRLEHRTDIRRSRTLFQRLMGELEAESIDEDGLLSLYDSVNELPADASKGQQDAFSKGRELLLKVLSLPSRVDSHKRLVETLEKLVKMERQAFGIEEEKEGGEGGASGSGSAPARRALTDVERAVRLAHLMGQMGAKPDASGAPAA